MRASERITFENFGKGSAFLRLCHVPLDDILTVNET